MSSISKFTEKYLNEMFSRYKSEPINHAAGEHLELEIRFKDITRDIFESLYTAIIGDKAFSAPTLECSVNFISSQEGAEGVSFIRKIVFSGSKTVSDTYYKKERVMRQTLLINDYLKYSVGLSKESIIPQFSAESNATVRFKVRVSFDYSGTWRFDLTAIRHGSLSGIGPHLKTIKSGLFTEQLTAQNILRELNHDFVDSFEVEIEHIGPSRELTLDDLNVTKKLFSLINPNFLQEATYQEEIYKVAEYIVTNRDVLHQFKHPSHRLKQLGNQVIALNKTVYYSDIYPPDKYYLTIKADGQRVIVSIDGALCRILRSDTMMEFGDEASRGQVSIADAEIIFDGKEKFTLYVFDVMVVRGENVSRLGLSSRLEHLGEIVDIINPLVAAAGGQAEAKKYIQLGEDNLEASFREIWGADYKFPRDGLILSTPNEPYVTTKNYKWKPLEKNTIDFLAVRAPQLILGIKPYEKKDGATLYLLFVGINQQMHELLGIQFLQFHRELSLHGGHNYYPVHFCPSANPLAYLYYHPANLPDIDRKIVELSLDADKGWIFHNIREDRKLEKQYFGNDFRVAELTYINYIDPFLFEDLWRAPSCQVKAATNIYMASNKYKRFVISLLLANNLNGAAWIIDEGAGRGDDLVRYQAIKAENVLFIDRDPAAITELIRRKFSLFSVKSARVKDGGAPEKMSAAQKYSDLSSGEYKKLVAKTPKNLTIHTLVTDLKTPYRELVAATFQFGVNPGIIDGIICNFALQYMCDTIENLRNLLIFNARMLKIGGLFIFTVMDGAEVFKLLKPIDRGHQWELRENDVVKYAIKKNYVGDSLSAAGQMISVKAPLCDEMYDEPLCNIGAVISEAVKLGFAVELNAPMSEYLNRFAAADKTLFDQLTLGDKTYISLHRFVSLRLVKNIKKIREN